MSVFHKLWKGIKIKVLYTAIISIIISILIIAYIINQQTDELFNNYTNSRVKNIDNDLRSKAKRIAYLLSEVSVENYLSNDFIELDSISKNLLKKDKDIVFIQFFDISGKNKVSGVGKPHGNYIQETSTVKNSGNTIGYLKIGISIDSTNKAKQEIKSLNDTAKNNILNTVIIALSVFLITQIISAYTAIHQMVIKPIKQLISYMTHTTKAETPQIIPYKQRNDEFDILFNTYNEMSHAINKYQDKLKQNIIDISENESKFRAIFEESSIGIALITLDGSYINMNKALQNTLGYTKEELQQISFMDITHPDDRETTTTHFQELLNGKNKSYTIEKRYIHKDKSIVWGLLNTTIVRDVNNNPIYVIGMIKDITEKKLNEEKILASQKDLESILNNMQDTFFRTDLNGNIQIISQSIQKLLGYSTEELINQNIDKLFTNPLGRSEILKELNQNHGVIEDYEIQLMNKNNNSIWSSVNLQFQYDNNKNIKCIEGTARDISQRKKSEEDLKESTRKLEINNRELKEFVYIASHDLQEPLRKVQVFGERISKTCSSNLPPEGLDYLDRMLNAARRMHQLIKDLLVFSRITSSERHFTPVNLNNIINGVVNDLEILIEQKNGIINIEELPVIHADNTHMRQLFQNFLSNALKFHKNGETPTIKIYMDHEKDPNSHVIVFEDNGIGIEEKHIDRIFGVFQKLNDPHLYEGTGIGLAICRKIVELYKGSITVESQFEKGTKFIISFPKVTSNELSGIKS